MRYLQLILFLLPILLLAQVLQPPSSGISLSGEAKILSEQAQLSFTQGNYSLAEVQYKALFQLEPYSQEALDGLFATWDALSKYKAILNQVAKLNKSGSQLFTANYHAYALLQLSRLPEARHIYHQALQSRPGDFATNWFSWNGLGYTYQALGDYHKSKKYFSYAQNIQAIDKSSFSTTLAYKIPGENKSAYSISQKAAYHDYHIKLSYENFLLDKKAFRQSYYAELQKEFSPVDISLHARSLSGEDDRVYPAWQAGLNAVPKLYLGYLILKPSLGLSYSHYPRFDVQQLSFLPTLLWRDFSLSYALHAVNLDNEAVDSDSLRFAQQLQLGKQLPLGMNIGLHFGTGNDTWLIDADNVAIDSFHLNGPYYGLSLSVPIISLLRIYAYHQRWKDDSLSYLALSVRY